MTNPQAESIDIIGPVTLITVSSYADLAHCSTATVKRDLVAGIIDGCKLGGTWLVALPKGSSWREEQPT